MADPDDILAAGTTFGRYAIGRRLGKGGMGVVYEATHLELRKQVALKMLLPSAARNAEARARFVREGEAAARLRHPHVVDISDVGVHDGVPYLVMEFLDGENLFDFFRREGALAVEELADLMLPVLDGVSAAHVARIVHRDLKPENIFLARTRMSPREPKILDFGISKLTELGADRELTATHTMVGTAHYMSPEQAQNSKDVDGRTDQYSLGVILYEGATGRHPFAAVGAEDSLFKLLQAITCGDFAPPRRLCPTLSEGFEQAVLRAMATRREDRFPSVQALAQALLPHASPAVRYTWARVLGADPVSVRPTHFGIAPRTERSSAEPAVDVEEAITAPSSPPPTIVAPYVHVPSDDVFASRETLSGMDTLGSSVRAIDFAQPPPPAARKGWKLVAALGGVLTLGLVVAISHHALTSIPPVASIPRNDSPTTVVSLPPAAHFVAREVPAPPPVAPVTVPILPTATDAGAPIAMVMPTRVAPPPTTPVEIETTTHALSPRRRPGAIRPVTSPMQPVRAPTTHRFPNL